MTIYASFLVPPAILIKATSYLLQNKELQNKELPFPFLLMSFFLMFGPHPFLFMMVLTTILFLLTITPSISGFTHYVENRMFIPPLLPSSNLLKTISTLSLKHFTLIMGPIFSPSVLSRNPWYNPSHYTSPHS